MPFLFNPQSLAVVEQQSASYRIRLVLAPRANVSVAITGHSSHSHVSFDVTTLTFTPDNFSDWQTIEISSAKESPDNITDEILTLTHTATSTDDTFDGNSRDIQVAILDDTSEFGNITISASETTISEDDGETEITVTIGTPATLSVIVPIDYSGYSNHDGPSQVTILIGSASVSFTLTVTADTDTDDDTLTVSLGTLPAGYFAGSVDSVSISITDNDSIDPPDPTDPADVTIGGTTSNITEGDDRDFTVNLDESLMADVVIPLTLTHVTTSSGDVSIPASVTIPSGDTTVTATITTVLQETDFTTKQFRVSIGTSLPDTVELGVPNSLTYTLANDDIELHLSTSASENADGNFDAFESVSFTFLVLRSDATSNAITVDLEYSDGSLVDERPPTTLTIPANATSSSSVTLTPVVDADTDDEELTISITSSSVPTGYALGTNGSIVIEITDETVISDDITVDLSASASTISEDRGMTTITVTLGEAASELVTIPISYSGYSNYTGASSIQIPIGRSDFDFTVTVTSDTDTTDDTLTVELGTLPDGYIAGGVDLVDITITDVGDPPDPPDNIEVSITSVRGNTVFYPQTQVLIRADTSSNVTSETEIPLRQTAPPASVIQWVQNHCIIRSGQSSSIARSELGEFDFNFVSSTRYGTSSVTIGLNTLPSGFIAGSPSSLTILHDFRIYISIEDAGQGVGRTATFNLSLAGPNGPNRTITCNWTTQDGPDGRDDMGGVIDPATAGIDYVAASGTVTFLYGARTATIEVSVNADTALIGLVNSRRFSVVLSNPNNALLDEATGTFLIPYGSGA